MPRIENMPALRDLNGRLFSVYNVVKFTQAKDDEGAHLNKYAGRNAVVIGRIVEDFGASEEDPAIQLMFADGIVDMAWPDEVVACDMDTYCLDRTVWLLIRSLVDLHAMAEVGSFPRSRDIVGLLALLTNNHIERVGN